MSAPFTSDDYQSLIIILRLPPTEIAPSSLLRRKGTCLEEIDAQNATDFVGQVQTAIASWLTAEEEKNAVLVTDTGQGIKSQSVTGEYSIEYGSRGSLGKYDSYEMRKRQYEADIRRLLQWDTTGQYVSFNTRANA